MATGDLHAGVRRRVVDAILRAPLLPCATSDRAAVSIRSSSRPLAGFAMQRSMTSEASPQTEKPDGAMRLRIQGAVRPLSRAGVQERSGAVD